MPQVVLIQNGVEGVDLKINPFLLKQNRLRNAVNMAMEEGVLKTRPAFVITPTGVSGVFQGATAYSPGEGLSLSNTADTSNTSVAFAARGMLYAMAIGKHGEAASKAFHLDHRVLFNVAAPVNLYAAEQYLIAQSPVANTVWWDGENSTISPGYAEEGANLSICGPRTSYLANSAGLGLYAHGRIHQQSRRVILVSDIIHKRGWKMADDILSMEEQASPSCGVPLSATAQMGELLALEILLNPEGPNGQGPVVAYHRNGVVFHNTAQAPRESRYDGEGKQVTQGWDTMRLSSVALNKVSATGRYAVAQTPRDHIFRSVFGIHWLRRTMGSESVADEPVNHIGHDVEPYLDADDPELLAGVALGYWVRRNRILCSADMRFDPKISATPYGAAILSLNRSMSVTDREMPLQAWEGLWLLPNDVVAIHTMLNAGSTRNTDGFGMFVTTGVDDIGWAKPCGVGTDAIGNMRYRIPWAFETGRLTFGELTKKKVLGGGNLEFTTEGPTADIEVHVRTDAFTKWTKWRDVNICKTKCVDDDGCGRMAISFSLDQPPLPYREATWFQFRVQGKGHVEIFKFAVDIVEGESKEGKSQCLSLDCNEPPIFKPFL